MVATSRVQIVSHLAPCVSGVLAVFALVACTRQAGQGYPHASNCPVAVYETHPGSDYVEIGQFSIEDTYIQGQDRPPFKSTDALLAQIRPDICSLGGEMLVIRRNAVGEIVQGTVYRRADVHEVSPPPPQPPSQPEICEPSGSDGLCHRSN